MTAHSERALCFQNVTFMPKNLPNVPEIYDLNGFILHHLAPKFYNYYSGIPSFDLLKKGTPLQQIRHLGARHLRRGMHAAPKVYYQIHPQNGCIPCRKM